MVSKPWKRWVVVFPILGSVLWFADGVRAGSTRDLPVELFAEGCWQDCIRECRRAETVAPADPAPRILAAIAAVRLGQNTVAALAQLERAIGSATNDWAALAAFEAGRARWRRGEATNAFVLTRTAFRLAAQSELFARSGCLLSEILRQFPRLGKDDPALFQTLETCRPLWTPEVVRDALGPQAAADSVAVRWIVALYRAQIRPALGSRCSLTPSCSEYFLQAGKQHGLLAFPMVADRLVREPGEVQAEEHPVADGEHLRYADPLEAHDGWLKSKGRP